MQRQVDPADGRKTHKVWAFGTPQPPVNHWNFERGFSPSSSLFPGAVYAGVHPMQSCISHIELTEITEIDFAAQNKATQMTQIFSPGGEIRVSHRNHGSDA